MTLNNIQYKFKDGQTQSEISQKYSIAIGNLLNHIVSWKVVEMNNEQLKLQVNNQIIELLINKNTNCDDLDKSKFNSFDYHQQMNNRLNQFIKQEYKVDYLQIDQDEALIYCVLKDNHDYLLNECDNKLNYQNQQLVASFMDYIEKMDINAQTNHSFWNQSYIQMTRSIMNYKYMKQKSQIRQFEIEKQDMDDQIQDFQYNFMTQDQQIHIIQTILNQFQCDSLQQLSYKFENIQKDNKKLIQQQNVQNEQFKKEHQYYEKKEFEIQELKDQIQNLKQKNYEIVEQNDINKQEIEDYEQKYKYLKQQIDQINDRLLFKSKEVESYKKQKEYLVNTKMNLEENIEKYQKQIKELEIELYENVQKLDRMDNRKQSDQKIVGFEKSYTNDYCKTQQSGQFMNEFQESNRHNWITNKKVILKEEDQQKQTIDQMKVREKIMFELVKDVVAFRL